MAFLSNILNDINQYIDGIDIILLIDCIHMSIE